MAQYITNCKSIFSRVAVDQIDSLRRHLLHKEEELKHLNKQFEYQEIEKIKIVKKLAQVEQDLDIKSHDLMKIKSQLGDKEDTLDVSTLYLHATLVLICKGQKIQKQNGGFLSSSMKPTIFSPDFCPKGLKWLNVLTNP